MMLRHSLVASVALAVFTTVLAVHAQDTSGKGGPPQIGKGKDGQPTINSPELAKIEKELAEKFSAFNTSLLTLQQRLANSADEKDKARAAQLKTVLDNISNTDITKQFSEFVRFLGQQATLGSSAEIEQAVQKSFALARDLKLILDMLRNDNGAGSRKEERIALEKLLKELEKVIRDQRIIGTEIQTNPDKQIVASNQGDVRDNAADIAKKMGKGGEAAEPKDDKGNSKEGGAGEKSKGKNEGDQPEGAKPGDAKKPGQEGGEAKPAGEKSGKGDPKDAKGDAKDGKGADAGKAGQGKDGKGSDAGKAGDNKKGGDAGKAGQGKDAGKKDGDPKGDGKAGGAKGEDKKADDKAGSAKASPDAQAPKDAADAKSGESPKADSESKPGQPSPGAKSGESKPGSESKGQGQAKAGQSDPAMPSPPPDVAGGKSDNQPPPKGGPNDPKDDTGTIKKKIQEGTHSQDSAQDSIKKGIKDEAAKESDKAIDNFEQAKKRLEALIRQLREEELERVLANLISRCQKMLAMQEEVLRGTVRVQAQTEAKPNEDVLRKISQDCINLSDDELKIVYEATKTLEILETEGSAVAFPVALLQTREDMKFVQRRLKNKDVGDVTVAIEQDIIDNLKEMVKALEKAKQELDNKKKDPKKDDPKQQDQKQQDQKLLDKIAELKMIKAMQLQVNARTQLYGKHYEGEQAMTDDIRTELRELAQRQERIFEVTRKIAKGDNQ